MLQKCVWAFCFFIFMQGPLEAQPASIHVYTHQLLFNILTEKPDTSIIDFLKLYIPGLYDKKKTQGILNTNASTARVPDHEEIHSFLFTKHPFFNEKFTRGKLDIYCKRYDDPHLAQTVSDIQLWFEFDSQEQAEIAFSRCIERFISVSTQKKFSSTTGAQQAEFSNKKDTTALFNRVRFRLTSDFVGLHRYKILFETTNDL